MISKQDITIVELVLGTTVLASFLTNIYLYPLYTTEMSMIFLSLLLPIIFATVVLASSIYNGLSPGYVVSGIAAGVTLLIGSGSLYAYVSTEGGVFFGGLITVIVSIGLLACVLIRELYYWAGRQRTSKHNQKAENA